MTASPGSRLSVLLAPGELEEDRLKGARVAVVDVLRATSVIPVALRNGASRVVPAASSALAMELRDALGRGDSLLCGEREGKMIPGFDLGNSPSEYGRERVAGKVLVYLSTNGAPVILRAQRAAFLVAASFVNAEAAVEALLREAGDVVLVAAGNQGRASLEDVVACGLLAARIAVREPSRFLDDGARMATDLWRDWEGNPRGLLGASRHGVYLTSLGFGADLDICARLDTVDCVPVLREGRLVPFVPAPSR